MSKVLYSPVKGKAVNLDQVNDEVFSKRLLGDGIAILPDRKEIYSPVDGVISMVFDTKHAIGIKTDSGIDILLHIGIDTVMLNGVPFHSKVQVGDEVKHGELLTTVDWTYIKEKGCDTIVSIVAINKSVKLIKVDQLVDPEDILLEILD